MSYIHFDKTQLVNLNYSLDREIIRTNRSGTYTSTTIIGCNTRKYHGLLVAPQPKIDSQNHVFLSTVHETVIQHGASFNLGISKFPGNYHPRGHKYLKDFDSEPIPKLTYRVGGVLLQKELILDTNRDRVMIRYTLLEAHSPTKIRIQPFLAFRGYHTLCKENNDINKDFEKVPNGVKFQLYPVYDPLYLQLSKKNTFESDPKWYNNVEYIIERERGYDYQEDLYVPGYFEFDIKKGESVIFAAGLTEADPATRQRAFEKEVARRIPRNNFENCLINSATQFIRKREGDTRIIAGYPWFGWWGRDTFVAAPGLTLARGDKETFLEIMDTMSRDLKGPLFPNVGSGDFTNMNSIDAPLWFSWSLQQYIFFTGDKKTIQKRYLDKLKGIIDGYREGTDFNIHVMDNGMVYGGYDGVALTWMDAVTVDGPVTPRTGSPVEIQALWYNALKFYEELSGDQEYGKLAEKAKESFLSEFWDEENGYLADVVHDGEKDWAIRPNMVFATSLPYSMLDENQKASILDLVRSKLLTTRGLRTLAPDDPAYKGYYFGDPISRDNAYHNGTVWVWPLGHFVDAYLKLHGKSAENFIKKIIQGFDGVMTQYGVGTVAEIFDGDAPHRPKGAISQAWSVGELLRMMDLIKRL
ncbi:glycogen debranching enzyme N-terminal domain-containing protein [Algoriphagus sp. NF]|jgi:predicted glycogen debranching enzyme|uniref:amylo-alpha-1,6-glucosidase n=1 Tax=Algoriphagus sp. NF TaxID=2992756 RepID=UPI001065075F|nr:amylo-alpha-1,6-glucosidase [Algoriphagus sp. NF]MDE0561370.1 glycogen debranching enzyme N-terminal domain-containing protein [Algoriphagus sp. NF]